MFFSTSPKCIAKLWINLDGICFVLYIPFCLSNQHFVFFCAICPSQLWLPLGIIGFIGAVAANHAAEGWEFLCLLAMMSRILCWKFSYVWCVESVIWSADILRLFSFLWPKMSNAWFRNTRDIEIATRLSMVVVQQSVQPWRLLKKIATHTTVVSFILILWFS